MDRMVPPEGHFVNWTVLSRFRARRDDAERGSFVGVLAGVGTWPACGSFGDFSGSAGGIADGVGGGWPAMAIAFERTLGRTKKITV